MAVNSAFNRTFGQVGSQAAAPAAASNNDREPTQVWLNVGYEAGDRFVSLPLGIPLDGMQPLAVKGKDEDFRDFTVARNDFLGQLNELAAKLEPGEEQILTLQVQMRRIEGASEAPTMTSTNKYGINLSAPAEEVQAEPAPASTAKAKA